MPMGGQARGFTLMEMVVVLTIATVLTSLGMVVAAEVIDKSRYNADRARVYLDMKEARDRAYAGMTRYIIEEVPGVPGAESTFTFAQVTSCTIGYTVLASTTVTYPAIDHAGDRTVCIDGRWGNTTQLVGGPAPEPFVNFQPVGVASNDMVTVNQDGTMLDSWKEFPDEGSAEASGCDFDSDTNCGQY